MDRVDRVDRVDRRCVHCVHPVHWVHLVHPHREADTAAQGRGAPSLTILCGTRQERT